MHGVFGKLKKRCNNPFPEMYSTNNIYGIATIYYVLCWAIHHKEEEISELLIGITVSFFKILKNGK